MVPKNVNTVKCLFFIIVIFFLLSCNRTRAEVMNELKVEAEYIYDYNKNIVEVVAHSSNKLKDNKPSWTISEDRLSYKITLKGNGAYETNFEDIYGNIIKVPIRVTRNRR